MNKTLAASVFVLVSRVAGQPGQIYNYTISTTVGNYQYGNDGPAAKALLASPQKITIDSKGAIYIADFSNNMIRKIVGGQITTIAGTGVAGFSGDGKSATSAQLSSPSGVAVDATGNVYICDAANHIIRKVDTNGIITTFAGTPQMFGSTGDGGLATQAKLHLLGAAQPVTAVWRWIRRATFTSRTPAISWCARLR